MKLINKKTLIFLVVILIVALGFFRFKKNMKNYVGMLTVQMGVQLKEILTTN